MKKFLQISGFVILQFFLVFSPAAAQQEGYSRIAWEVDYLMRIWPGNFDNQEQVSLDAAARKEKESDQNRFHAVVRRIALPELGSNILYLEEHEISDVSKLHNQRVLALIRDDESNAIRIKSYGLKNVKSKSGTNRYLNKPVEISAEDVVPLPGCDYLVRRDGDMLAGKMESGKCKIAGGTGYLERSLEISENHYSFRQHIVDGKGAELSAVNAFRPRKMVRARWFACMVDVPKDIPDRSTHTQHYIKIHDQGGRFDFVHPDGRKMYLLMRNTWSYGMQRETFFIGVFEPQGADESKLLVYAWGDPGSDRIGLNPGYVRIQCDVDTARNVQLQDDLRPGS